MTSNSSKPSYDELFENKYVKASIYFIGGIVVIYLSGMVFKLLNNSIKGYKELRQTIMS